MLASNQLLGRTSSTSTTEGTHVRKIDNTVLGACSVDYHQARKGSAHLLSMEVKRDEPETINVWELMSGLDDDNDDADVCQRSIAQDILPSTTLMANSPLPEPFTLEPESGDELELSSKTDGRRPRRSMVTSSKSTTRNLPISLDASSTIMSAGDSSSVFLGDETMPPSFQHIVDDLQRSVSFRCAINNDSKSTQGEEEYVGSKQSKASTRSLSSEMTSRSPLTSEPGSSPSSSLSLKKWFHGNYRVLKQRNSWKAGFKSLFHENHSKKKISEEADSVNVEDSENNRNTNSADLNNKEAYIPCLVDQVQDINSTEAGRNWHSFSNSNRNKQFMEDRKLPPVNRPSSWELEKVVTDPAVKLVLYSTSSQTDIDAYEDSNAVRAILMSLVGSSFDEKSISQHSDYEQELKAVLNMPTALVPAIYVRGRYIAGIDNIMQLYKKGILRSLLLEVYPHCLKPDAPCACRGGKFLICPICKGKRKLTRRVPEASTCRHCSGTGLIKCPGCLRS